MPFPTLPTRASTYGVTAANWNDLVNFLNSLREVGYGELGGNQTVTATTVGTATQIVQAGSLTYEAVPHMIEFFCGRVNVGANACNLILRDGTTVLGTLAQMPASANIAPVYAARRLTPTAASHNYNVAAWNSAAATATFIAGTGGAAGDQTTYLPCFIRTTPIPT